MPTQPNNESELTSSTPGNQIESLSGMLQEDGKRVRVTLTITDVSQRPNIELALLDAGHNEITRSIILGVMNTHLEFTLHLGKQADGSLIFVSAVIKNEDALVINERVEVVK